MPGSNISVLVTDSGVSGKRTELGAALSFTHVGFGSWALINETHP